MIARPRTVLAASAAACVIACIIHATAACSDSDGSHIYVGSLYLEDRHCLGTPSSVDVVEGEPPGDCQAICLRQTRSEGGHAIYVATMCPPYPGPDFDQSGTDPQCAPALAALARGDICSSDGGSSNPIADAAPDATMDASSDGMTDAH